MTHGAGSHEDRIDTTVPHPARRYNYWLGGKDNFAADRESGDAIAALYPAIRTTVQENRKFLRRAVHHLTAERGVRQFLDIGTGIPTADNTHEVAQSLAPDARIVYVDNDPIVLTHARALLRSTASGATAYLDADLRDPKRILNHPDLRATLDLTQPVALMLIAIVHFLFAEDEPYDLIRTLVDGLPAGSYLVMTHGTMDFVPAEIASRAAAEIAAGRLKVDAQARTKAEVTAFFDGLEVLEPGVVPITEWRPVEPPEVRPPASDVSLYGAVARLP